MRPILVLAALLALAAPARAAAPRVVTRGFDLGNLGYAGSTLLWGHYSGADRRRRFVVTDGTRARVSAPAPDTVDNDGYTTVDYSFAPGAGSVALYRASVGVGAISQGAETWLGFGRWSGSLATLYDCSFEDQDPPYRPFAVDGDAVAYGSDCSTDVELLNAGHTRTLPMPPGEVLRGVALAGDYVALVSGPQLTTDKTTQRVRLLRRSDGAVPVDQAGQPLGSVALSSDGTVALCGRQLELFSPADPVGHVAATSCAAVSAGGGRIVYVTPTGDVRVVAPGGDTVAVRGATRASEPVTDGTDVAYKQPDCDGYAILRAPLGSVSRAAPVPRRCPVRVLTHRATQVGRRAFEVRLRCPRGCTVDLGLARRPNRASLLTRDEQEQLGPGTHTLRLALGARPRGRVLRLMLMVESAGPLGGTHAAFTPFALRRR